MFAGHELSEIISQAYCVIEKLFLPAFSEAFTLGLSVELFQEQQN